MPSDESCISMLQMKVKVINFFTCSKKTFCGCGSPCNGLPVLIVVFLGVEIMIMSLVFFRDGEKNSIKFLDYSKIWYFLESCLLKKLP